MLAAGEPIPDVEVLRAPADAVSLRALAEEGPYLLLAYLLDWTGV